jgi:RimJ/RimL family protein N-acetyltransferase
MRIQLGTYHLSPHRADDGPALVRHLEDGRVSETIPVIPFPYRPEHADAFLQRRLALLGSGPPIAFAVRDAAGALCGGIDLEPDSSDPSAELGYWISADLWGRGIMTSVVPAFLSHARSSLALKRITARAFCTNIASLRLLRRNGFRSLGIMPRPLETRRGPAEAEAFDLDLSRLAESDPYRGTQP